MKWDEVKNQYPETSAYTNLQKTDIDCPKCGEKIFKRTDIVLTTWPAMYQYECKCGWVGYAHL